MGGEPGGWDSWKPVAEGIAFVVGLAGGVLGLVAFFLRYANPPDRIEGWYRTELAAKLRGANVGSIYRDLLTKGLDWLDEHWGEPGAARALGVCIIIAICYGYAAFFLAWGVGGPGHIGGKRLAGESIEGGIWLLNEADQPARSLWALWVVVAPALGFFFGRWLGRRERRLKAQLRRGYRWRRRRFEIGYRAALVVIFVSAVTALAVIKMALAEVGLMFALLAVGPTVGIAVARRTRRDFSAGLLAAGAGAVALAGVFAVARALAVAVAVARAMAGAFAVVGAVAGAGAIAGIVAGAFAAAGTVPVSVSGDVAVALSVPVAVAGALGAAAARRQHRGAFAGGLGALVVLGLILAIIGFAGDEFAVILLVFFLVLPVINGFWDWLSWWVTRLLGQHLLASLSPARALGGRAATILGHGLLDLVLSAALLAGMAFLLAFGFETYDQIAEAQGRRAFDLGPYLAAAADRPWTDGLWLTVMLLSTLFPTALHVVALLASPLALMTLPTEKRLALASELETWDEQPKRHASIQRRAGQYVARERHGAIAIAAGLFILLTFGLLALINLGLGMLEPGQSVAQLVLWIAEAGRTTADALAATLGI